MLNLTRQEQLIILLLTAGLLAGAVVLAVRGRLEPPDAEPAVFTVELSDGGAERSRGNKTPPNPPLSRKINLNEATAEELELLPGIGPVLARRIVEYRDENGRFNDTRDVLDVKGVGEYQFKLIADFVTVD